VGSMRGGRGVNWIGWAMALSYRRSGWASSAGGSA
jgi:hypothetical protein